ncbi:4Fe-4S single cluster domain-containing protein [Microbacterium stercoris]|uniref:Radical SAM protein n=1 Tax=Microbacterium stercoris TaxID=2820289 RepID=A0A939TW00_9MICO|nr:4Fe-4S single cluster domain-containing protein [Microbacterium stercoris]MBO3662117.1 radical SAM protein [Microbacterium stercoris]
MTSVAAPTLRDAAPVPRDGAYARWSRFVPATEAEGPGLRAALWLQGCDVRCPGCFNPQLWAHRGARLEAAEHLATRFVREAREAGSTGLTLLGGEPFDQAGAAATIAEAFRAEGLTVMTFTGYTHAQLRAWEPARPDIARLLAATDLLADGPYLRDHPDPDRPWIGSRNQGLTALTPAHRDDILRIEKGAGARDRLEIRVGPDGRVEVNGWADDASLESLLHDLGARDDAPAHLANRTEPTL